MTASHHDPENHDSEILDQFTRQADPFAQRHGYGKDALLDLMADCAAVGPDDDVLDVACGPGIIACFFARRARHVTGLDFVPAMLDRARRYQQEQGVANVSWQQGSSTALPFEADDFDCVVTRFSFHHFLSPAAALAEMERVAKPGGRIVVSDVVPSPETQERFNFWEILRDPSHTRALTQAEFEQLGKAAGLDTVRIENTRFERDLEDLLAGSFPKPGDDDRIRALFEAEVAAGTDSLGAGAYREAGLIKVRYPVAVFAWRKPARV
jgi:SAM-dependent methyltransferase